MVVFQECEQECEAYRVLKVKYDEMKQEVEQNEELQKVSHFMKNKKKLYLEG